jgi:hypothetical protein
MLTPKKGSQENNKRFFYGMVGESPGFVSYPDRCAAHYFLAQIYKGFLLFSIVVGSLIFLYPGYFDPLFNSKAPFLCWNSPSCGPIVQT